MKIKRKIYECKSEICVCLIKGDYEFYGFVLVYEIIATLKSGWVSSHRPFVLSCDLLRHE